MKKSWTYRLICAVWLMCIGFFGFDGSALAQRINFSTWTGSDDIIITSPQGVPSLNFSQKQPITVSNPQVSINLMDNEAAVFQIQAPEGFDLTVEIDAPSFLRLDGTGSQADETVPFQIAMAYNNMEAGDQISAKTSAVPLPAGFFNVTFPVSRRSAGAPGPPPTPISGGDVRVKSTAWLFLYGSLGPVGNVKAGNYSGDITINVFFTSNNE